jgi:hypothetical protein
VQAIRLGLAARSVPIAAVQRDLLQHRAVLIHYRDVDRDHPAFPALQFVGIRGGIIGWEAHLEQPASAADAARWSTLVGLHAPVATTNLNRGQVLLRIWEILAQH